MNHEVKLRPFNIPEYVFSEQPASPRGEGYSGAAHFRLSELSEATLSELCDEFRRGVFEKAGRDKLRNLIETPNG